MTSPRPYSRLLNFAWYQLLWFSAVLGGFSAMPLLLVLLTLHVLLVSERRSELALMAGAAGLGTAFDAFLIVAGFYRFEGSEGPQVLPLWLPVIWMGFAATLRHSMAFMAARPRLMTAAATIFAPLTYLAAERLGAVNFPHGNLATAVVIALSWWAITPLLLRIECLTREPQALLRALSLPHTHRSEV